MNKLKLKKIIDKEIEKYLFENLSKETNENFYSVENISLLVNLGIQHIDSKLTVYFFNKFKNKDTQDLKKEVQKFLIEKNITAKNIYDVLFIFSVEENIKDVDYYPSEVFYEYPEFPYEAGLIYYALYTEFLRDYFYEINLEKDDSFQKYNKNVKKLMNALEPFYWLFEKLTYEELGKMRIFFEWCKISQLVSEDILNKYSNLGYLPTYEEFCENIKENSLEIKALYLEKELSEYEEELCKKECQEFLDISRKKDLLLNNM